MNWWVNTWINEFSSMVQQETIGFSYCQSNTKAAKRGVGNKSGLALHQDFYYIP